MKKTILMMALAAFATSAGARVRLPHLLGDGMIVQQQTDVRLWGWDKPGTTVKATTSWSDQTATAKTDKTADGYSP